MFWVYPNFGVVYPNFRVAYPIFGVAYPIFVVWTPKLGYPNNDSIVGGGDQLKKIKKNILKILKK